MGRRDFTTFLPLLQCPICYQPFMQEQQAFRCPTGHSFDVAHEGYVNLLRKQLPGDTKEMLLARRATFSQGLYQPLSDAIHTLLWPFLIERAQHADQLRCYDAGCGEGYYLGRLHEALLAEGRQSLCMGCDISKDAIRLAAKRYPTLFFQVANIKERLPLGDQVLDLLLNIFAPRNADEFSRVIAPDAFLLVVIPGPQHLQQLRNSLQLLHIEEQKEQHVVEQFASSFALLSSKTVTYDRVLASSAELTQLVMMTPNYWHLTEEQRRHMSSLTAFITTFDFRCLLFSRSRMG